MYSLCVRIQLVSWDCWRCWQSCLSLTLCR
jgi:hypothetical protein